MKKVKDIDKKTERSIVVGDRCRL